MRDFLLFRVENWLEGLFDHAEKRRELVCELFVTFYLF